MRIETREGMAMKRRKGIRQIVLWSLPSAVVSALIVTGVQTLWTLAGDEPSLHV
jgi:hypothetical protein